MTRVDFYLLAGSSSIEEVTCILTEKARQRGHSIHIRTASRQDAAMLDELLWTYKDTSFIPHRLAGEAGLLDTPVCIGWDEPKPEHGDVLINLVQAMPLHAASFNRVIEIVPARESERESARARFRQYRDQGYDLHHHPMGASDAET